MNRVSVIIPVYNGESSVGRAIDCALAQRFEDAEIVVVNDGSTDPTARVLERYRGRIKVVTQPNRGPSAARNAGVANSTGEYLAFLDADDRWLPGKLVKSVNALDRNPKAILVFSEFIHTDKSGRRLAPSRIGRAPSMQDLLRCSWPILTSAVVMRRSAFERCGGFCEEFRRPGGDDAYLWLLAREQGEFEYISEPLMLFPDTSPLDVIDKYEAGGRTFIRLVRKRYGRLARPLVKEVRNYFAGTLAVKALMQMDEHDLGGALRTWMRVVWYRPLYLFAPETFGRLFAARNIRRLLKALRPRQPRTGADGEAFRQET